MSASKILRPLAAVTALAVLAGTARAGGEDDWLRPIGGGKAAAPQRIKGGESFPPLPLPATPLQPAAFSAGSTCSALSSVSLMPRPRIFRRVAGSPL